MKHRKRKISALLSSLVLIVSLVAYNTSAGRDVRDQFMSSASRLLPELVQDWMAGESKSTVTAPSVVSLDEIPEFSGSPYAVINSNEPYFTDEDLTLEPFERFSDLDHLGRCGVAYANVCRELMPTEPRGEIGQVKPSGWHTVKYDWVDGKYLYNRCHLLGFQLTGENANKKNLITGTRYMNVDGMLPFENMIDDYVEETGNHVLYRVTPIFEGENLVANGVLMEALSVEDAGEGVRFNVFCYNAQPGVAQNGAVSLRTHSNTLDQYSAAFSELAKAEGVELLDESKLRQALSKYSVDEVERTYDACFRFGIQEVYQNLQAST